MYFFFFFKKDFLLQFKFFIMSKDDLYIYRKEINVNFIFKKKFKKK